MTTATGKRTQSNYDGRDYPTYEFLMSKDGQKVLSQASVWNRTILSQLSYNLRIAQPLLIDQETCGRSMKHIEKNQLEI